MFSLKTLLSLYSNPCLKPPINPFQFVTNPNHAHSLRVLRSWLIALETQRPISGLAQLEKTQTSPKSQETNPNEQLKRKSKRRLDVLFKEAVGLCERRDILEIDIQLNRDDDNTELKNKLWELEMELRQLKEKLKGKIEGGSKSKPKSLVALFAGENGEREKFVGDGERVGLKEISEDMQVLLRHLYDRGYFDGVNFLHKNKFDISSFDNVYARDFLKFAVEKFGKDNQDISKWLSGSDLKTIALFGCPSRKTREVFAAKRLRTFFQIPEETVCSTCSLKESCKFVNQSVWFDDTENLRLDLLMRVLRTYSLEDIPPQLKLTDDFKACVSRLIYEIINLTKESSK